MTPNVEFATAVQLIIDNAVAIARECEDQSSYYEQLGERIVKAWHRLRGTVCRIQYEVQQTVYTDDLTKWRPAIYAEDGGVEQLPSLEIAVNEVAQLVRAGASRERLRIVKRTITEDVVA